MRLDALLVDVLDALPDGIGEASTGVRVSPVSVEFELPIELAWSGGELWASLARSRIVTGFDAPLSRMRARAVAEAK